MHRVLEDAARRRPLGRPPLPVRARPERAAAATGPACTRADVASTRCSSSHVSTSAAGAARSPQSSSSVASTSTSHGPSSALASPAWARPRRAAPPPAPHTSSAHGPSSKSTRTRTPPSTCSHSTRRRVPLNGSHSSGSPTRRPPRRPSSGGARPDRTGSCSPASRMPVVGLAGRIEISVARGKTAGTNSTAARRRGAAASAPARAPARHALRARRRARRARRRAGWRPTRSAPQLGDRPVVAACPAARPGHRPDRDQRPARVHERVQPPAVARLEHRAARQHDAE